MTNKEFYGDKLLAIVLEDTCRKLRIAVYGESCAEKDCKDCEFYTVERVEHWLNVEHEEPKPPLFENGDGLKPGDWIMVRNHESDLWNKRQFLCFYGHLFIAVDDDYSPSAGGMFSSWKFARLPMEGE